MGNVNQTDTAVDLVIIPDHLRIGAAFEVTDDSLHSDHLPILAKFTLPGDRTPNCKGFFSTRRWKAGADEDWDAYQQAVREGLAELHGPAD